MNLYRLIIGLLFLIVTLLDIYKAEFIHYPLFAEHGFDLTSILVLKEALIFQSFMIVIYILLILIYAWKFSKNKFFTRYLYTIDVFILIYVCYMVYLCIRYWIGHISWFHAIMFSGIIDNLSYSYDGNRLQSVSDVPDNDSVYKDAMHFVEGSSKDIEYTYDSNGNLLSESDKGIQG